jgi:hypothetical protein
MCNTVAVQLITKLMTNRFGRISKTKFSLTEEIENHKLEDAVQIMKKLNDKL